MPPMDQVDLTLNIRHDIQDLLEKRGHTVDGTGMLLQAAEADIAFDTGKFTGLVTIVLKAKPDDRIDRRHSTKGRRQSTKEEVAGAPGGVPKRNPFRGARARAFRAGLIDEHGNRVEQGRTN